MAGGLWFGSTEIQRTRSSSWEVVAEYPIAVKGLSGATINNIIYMSGGKTRQCHVVQFKNIVKELPIIKLLMLFTNMRMRSGALQEI